MESEEAKTTTEQVNSKRPLKVPTKDPLAKGSKVRKSLAGTMLNKFQSQITDEVSRRSSAYSKGSGSGKSGKKFDLKLRLIEMTNVDNISEDDSIIKVQIRQEGKFKMQSQKYNLADDMSTIKFESQDVFQRKIAVPIKFYLEISKDQKVIDQTQIDIQSVLEEKEVTHDFTDTKVTLKYSLEVSDDTEFLKDNAEFEALTFKIFQLETDNNKLQDEKAKLQTDNERLEQKNKVKDSAIDSLNATIEEQKNEIAKKDEEISKLQGTSDLPSKTDLTTKKLQGSDDHRMESNQGGSSENGDADVKRLKEELAQAMQSIEILNKDLKYQKYMVSESKSEVEALRKENRVLQGISEFKKENPDFNFSNHQF